MIQIDFRSKAIKLVGQEVEEEIFKRTTTLNYAFVIRKVLPGENIDEAP